MITDLQPPTVGLRSPIVTTPRPNGCCSCLIDIYAASAWIHLCFYQRSKRICGLHWPIFLSNSLMVWGNGWLNKCQLSNVKAITTYHASGQSNAKPNNIPSLKGIEINVLSSLEVVSIGGVAISHPWKCKYSADVLVYLLLWQFSVIIKINQNWIPIGVRFASDPKLKNSR